MDTQNNLQEKTLQAIFYNPANLLLVYVVFFLVGFYLYWNEIQSSNDNNKTDAEKFVHFRDLPSPRGYPIVGHMTKLGSRPYLVFTEWSKMYSAPLLRIKMGFQDVLVITGFETIRKAALKQGVTFAGRPNFDTFKVFSEGLSIAFSDYSEVWKRQKLCAKMAINMYTTGKDPTKRSIMENSAAKHADNLVDQLIHAAEKQNGVVNPRELVVCNMANTICFLCFGEDFDVNDPKLRQLLAVNKNFDEAMGGAQLINFWPMLKHFPFVGRSFQKLKFYQRKFEKFLASLMESHWDTYEDTHMRDIADCLYHEHEKLRSTNETKTIDNGSASHSQTKQNSLQKNKNSKSNAIKFLNDGDKLSQSQKDTECDNDLRRTERHGTKQDDDEKELQKRIICSIVDIFGAGFDTTATVINWAFLYLAAYPETQSKIREEIEKVIAPEESPSFRLHSARCPYTQAWIYELLRHTSLTPLLIPHCTKETTVLENCIIPAGTTVFFNTWQAHKDPQLWENPEEFIPTRFLTECEGAYSLRKNVYNKLLTFGLGPRKCPGQDISRQIAFIFLCVIVRRCEIAQSKPGMEPVLPWPTTLGVGLKPKSFAIALRSR